MDKSNVINKKTVTSSLVYKNIEIFASKGIRFLFSIVLARLLMPDDYGIYAITTIFINFLSVFMYSGFTGGLVQKSNPSEKEYSSVFVFMVVLSFVLFASLFFSAPMIANIYDDNRLIALLRVLSITFVIQSLQFILNTKVKNTMRFKTSMIASLAGLIVGSGVAVYFAYKGFGVWSLVILQLVSTFINVVLLSIQLKWLPRWYFKLDIFKPFFQYGWKILVNNLISSVFANVRGLIVGKVYSTSDLGYYNRGKSYPQQIVSSVASSLQVVLFPVFSNFKNDKAKIKSILSKSFNVSYYLLLPVTIGMIAVAEPMVRVVLTEKWLPSVPYLIVFCIYFMFNSIPATAYQSIKAIGRSDIPLKISFVLRPLELVLIVIAIKRSVLFLAITVPIITIIESVVCLYITKRMFNYSLCDIINDIKSSFIMAFIMGILVYFIGLINIDETLLLVIQIILGALCYYILSLIFKPKAYCQMIDIINQIKDRKRRV